MSFEKYESCAAVIADLQEPKAVTFLDNGVAFNHTAQVGFADKYKNGKARPTGTLLTGHLESFVDYVNNNGNADNTSVFINAADMKATAILNYGADGYQMGHGDYRAILSAKPFIIFDKILEMHNNGRYSQRVFANILEDWMHEFKAYDDNDALIDIKNAISALRDMVVGETVDVTSSVSNFGESRSKFESVEAHARGRTTPAYFSVSTKCYDCLDEERTIKMRLGISKNDGKVEYRLSIIGAEKLVDDLATDFAKKVQTCLPTDFDVYVGTFQP